MIDFGAKPEVYVKGLISPEGPAFDTNGTLYICDFGVFPPTDDPAEAMDRNVYRVSNNGQLEVFVNTGSTGGMPTGSAFHKDGRLFLCDSGRAELLAIDSTGSITVLASEYQGRPLHGPNDLAFDGSGNLYFTDPKGSSVDNPVGNVYLYRCDGGLELVGTGYAFPNGIAIGPDGRSVYLAETQTQRIYRFDLSEDGHFTKRTLFVELAHDRAHPEYGPDGMAFDIEGNLYIAHWGRGCVVVVDPEGELIGKLPTLGNKPTNVAFWGTALYITEMENGQVVRLDIGVEGLGLFGSTKR
jgi:sugar lactone lactonase YvrE